MPFLTARGSNVQFQTQVNGSDTAVVLPFKSESINPKSNTLNTDAIFASRFKKPPVITQRSFQGSVDIELWDSSTKKHFLLGLLLYSMLGKYETTPVKVIKADNNVPEILLNIQHGTDPAKIYKGYSTSLALRFPADGIATATFDFLGKMNTTVISGAQTIAEAFYTAKNLKFELDTTVYSNMIRNFELTVTNNILQAYAWGSLDAVEMTPGMVDPVQMNVEFYVDNLSSGLFQELENVYISAKPSTKKIKITISSPTVDNDLTPAILEISDFTVTELSHDISGNDYILCKAALNASAESIVLKDVTL